MITHFSSAIGRAKMEDIQISVKGAQEESSVLFEIFEAVYHRYRNINKTHMAEQS